MKNNRIKKLSEYINQQGYLITDPADLFYLTGLELEGYWLLVLKDEAVIFTSEMLKNQIKKFLKNISIVTGENLLDLVLDYCVEKNIKELSIDYGRSKYSVLKKLSEKLKVTDADNLVLRIRQIKDKKEIKLIKKSCEIASKTAQIIQKYIRPGLTESAIMFKIEEIFAKNHVRPSFKPIVAAGPNSANPHHLSSTRKVGKNDVVLVDLGCIYKGYCSDLTRTFILGKINDSIKAIYNIVNDAHNSAINAIYPGKGVNNIDNIARRTIASKGFEKQFIHSTGHGVGIEVHELPRVNRLDKTELKPGMIITVEPGIYLSGKFGVNRRYSSSNWER